MFVPPPLIRHRRARGTKAFYLPALPPVFVLPGRERLAQHPAAVPHQPQRSSVRCQPDVFDIVSELRNDEASSPLRQNSSQRRQNQWRRWSENIIPALVRPYLYYLEASQSLRVVVDTKVGDQSQCPACTLQQLTVYCLFFDRALAP